jgi:hypothetical protein
VLAVAVEWPELSGALHQLSQSASPLAWLELTYALLCLPDKVPLNQASLLESVNRVIPPLMQGSHPEVCAHISILRCPLAAHD